MPFSTGQTIFAIVFVLAFVSMLIWAYIKDQQKQSIYFKGTIKIIAIMLLILVALRFLVKYLN